LSPLSGYSLQAAICALDGRKLQDMTLPIEVGADTITKPGRLDLTPLLTSEKVVLVSLKLIDGSGKLVSDNFYWQAARNDDLRLLSAMTAQPVTLTATETEGGGERVVAVTLTNQGAQPALMSKLTLEQGDDRRVLPAYADGNYISLLPGESRLVTIRAPEGAIKGPLKLALRGWNVQPTSVMVTR
jgi:hypothetical protein